jgi:hypothetical protein
MTNYPLDNINKEIAFDIVDKLEGKKRISFLKALDRNDWLTSVWTLDTLTMVIYKEGFYVTFEGTRCKFSVFAYDRDGEFEIAERKPHDSKLHPLYTTYGHTDEDDYRKFLTEWVNRED